MLLPGGVLWTELVTHWIVVGKVLGSVLVSANWYFDFLIPVTIHFINVILRPFFVQTTQLSEEKWTADLSPFGPAIRIYPCTWCMQLRCSADIRLPMHISMLCALPMHPWVGGRCTEHWNVHGKEMMAWKPA